MARSKPAPAKRTMPLARQMAARRAVIAALRTGATRSAASAAGQISRETFYQWLADDVNENTPYRVEIDGEATEERITFPDAVRRAEDEAEFRYAATLRKAATEAEVIDTYDRAGNLIRRVTKYDWKAAAWWLERRRKESWRPPAQVEVSGPDGGPVKTETVEFKPTDEFRREFAAAIAELPPEVREARTLQED